MKYLKTTWVHEPGRSMMSDTEEYPILIFSEVDDERWETRKVEFYPSLPPRYGSDKDFRAWQSFLADQPYPPIDEIQNDETLQTHEISQAEFEDIWLRIRLETRKARRDGGAIYDKLDAIDAFESRFGNREALKRVCDLMTSYLAEATKPLPPIAAQAARVAIDYKNGLASLADLDTEREAIRDFLRNRHNAFNYDHPEFSPFHAVFGALGGYMDPSWSGGASELIACFWEMMERFDCNEELLLRLFREHFPWPNR